MFALLLLASMSTRASAQDAAAWVGAWDTQWRDGQARLELETDGGSIRGRYVPRDGRIRAELEDGGRVLVGSFTEDGRRGTFRFTLAPDGESFMGRFDSGEWWNGEKLRASENLSWQPSFESPRDAMRSFLVAFNEVRYGGLQFVRPGLRGLVFSDPELSATAKFRSAMLLFEIVDLCVVSLWDLPDERGVARGSFRTILPQLGTGLQHEQEFLRSGERWRLFVPSEESLIELRDQLREARGITTPNPSAHFELRTPRDCIRTFIEEVKRWDEGGAARVLRTFDLSEIEESVRATEAPLLAEYLQQVLDRAGFLVWQELPNDPESHRPYVHFEHPRGDITVARYETESGPRWRFTAETLRDVRALYDAFEDMPVAEGLDPVAGRSTYFQLRSWFRARSPRFVERIGLVETWQLILLGILLLGGFLFGGLISGLPRMLARKKSDEVKEQRRSLAVRYFIPLALILTGLLLHELLEILGIPPSVFWLLSSFTLVLVSIGATWLAFSIVNSLGARLAARAESGQSALDEISVSLLISTLKIVVVLLGLFATADVLAVPYRTVFAGLGIGGLAFAIAAQDTLANFFGSAVLLADRPFRRGDHIVAGELEGFVEHLGLRSTRLRTFDDSIVVVPNRELAKSAIDNRSQRRERRFEFVLGVEYDTSGPKLLALTEALHEALSEFARDEIRVGVDALGDSAIEIKITLGLVADAYSGEVASRQDVLLRALTVCEQNGVSLAFPTRTLHMATSKPQEEADAAVDEVGQRVESNAGPAGDEQE